MTLLLSSYSGLCRRYAVCVLLMLGVLQTRAGILPPVDIQLPIKELHENNPIGATVSTFLSNDAGSSSYVYTLVAGEGDTSNASFTIQNGMLLAAVVFDYEVKKSHSIRVRATDAAGGYLEKIFTITIADVYETPGKLECNNLLTPNGDGFNDTWVIKNLDLGKNNELFIYDRVGRMVYSKKNYQNDFNGTVGGSNLAEGTYYYIIDLGPNQFKGFITLVRDKH